MPIKLKTLKYWERVGQPKEWVLEGLSLGPINLIVGVNATGKSRTINVLSGLARHFLPETKITMTNGGYDVIFDHDGQELTYIVDVINGKVQKEELLINQVSKLRRWEGGEGEIVYAGEGARKIRFKPPENELAAVVRRDSLQHPFLEGLYEWALGVRHYLFGTELGRNIALVLVNGAPDVNDRDTTQVLGIFRKAANELGQAFVDAVINDMAELRYDIEAIEVPTSTLLLGANGIPRDLKVLAVKEKDIEGMIEQMEMSQGMFRALSILIQVNYSQMANRANCILIDDIGEGLDFERSSRLIDLIIRKASESQFQLVMTTNDQFVMNHVPLKHWSVLQRKNKKITVHNYQNSKELFEEFKFFGLSNFSFLEMDFVNGSQKMQELATHE